MDGREQKRRRRRPPWWLATVVLLPTMFLLVTVLGMPFNWALVIGVLATIATHAVVRYRMLKSSMREPERRTGPTE